MNLLPIIFTAMFSANFVLVKFFGICPFLGVSKNIKSAFGMGIAVTLVMTITCLITYPIYTFILVPLGVDYLEIIVFIFVIASLVQIIEIILKKTSKALYQAMGVYLPLITTNCAVLGVAELCISGEIVSNLLGAVTYGLFGGLGFTLAMIIMSGMREKLDTLKVPKCLEGFPISMLLASFMAMAFNVFAGITF
ncbi:MAG: electron transport complex subunit RsxA [Clostridia bacterium]|nr:electron transport complex subunit RsxA [Clostridia bacterium]MBR7135916.1 electron transport complex subunit RsxA [Clostridia bacterium]